jgi:hypothetical protein
LTRLALVGCKIEGLNVGVRIGKPSNANTSVRRKEAVVSIFAMRLAANLGFLP